MPERKKGSRPDAAKSSAARSRKRYSVHLDDDLRAELRSWPKSDRKRVGSLIRRVKKISATHIYIPASEFATFRRKEAVLTFTSAVSVEG